jgi:hypothetical protein
LTGGYKDPNPERAHEIFCCAKTNVDCRQFDKVVFFLENGRDEYEKLASQVGTKIVLVDSGRRTKYSDFIEWGNANLDGRIVVAANSDVYFDDTISLVHEYNMAGRFWALTRREPYSDFALRHDPHKTQDVWIWQAPLVINTDLELGRPGCENHFAWLAWKVGLKVANPSLSIKVYHRHQSGLRRYSNKERVMKPYLHIKPSRL